jgi:predicted nicotinamide N-methyase
MGSSARAFVLRHTRLQPVPGHEQIRLHLADDVLALWHATQLATGDPETPLPYWGFAWSGGLAIARYLRDQPGAVAGRRVFDLGTGSGLCAIAASQAGALEAIGVDVDPFAAAAVAVNARANGVRVRAVLRDVLDSEPPAADVVLAGDCWYDAGLSARVLAWLKRVAASGAQVVIGDPGRRYLPLRDLIPLASYEVRTTTMLEDLDHKRATVHTLRPESQPTRSGDPARVTRLG